MKRHFIISVLLLLVYGVMYAQDAPSVTTNSVTNISQTSATGGGTITSNGGAAVTKKGICWSTEQNPDTTASHLQATGSGNTFSCNMTNLTPGTTYYVRGYAVNSVGIAYGSQVNFTTIQNAGLPSVTTGPVTNISQTSATGGGHVISDGGAMVLSRGVCWSTSANPTIANAHTTNGTGIGQFTSNITGLSPNTLYYVRAYATNSQGTAYGNETTFFTNQNHTVSVSADPINGGSPYIGNNPGTTSASFTNGQACTVHAIAISGYVFVNWTENGNVVAGAGAHYTFTVNGSRTLVAHFTQQYTITVSASPSYGGSAYVGNTQGTITATYTNGQTCTVHASAYDGYVFVNWTENGTVVSTSADYTFTVGNSNRTLVANFIIRQYTINVSASPTAGGTVSGGGTYTQGQSCTVTATANDGYTFKHWKENGNVIQGAGASYTFTVTGNRTLVAHFEQQSYTITANADPEEGGTVSGGGTYTQGANCTVSATAADGYTFSKWTENGNEIQGAGANYTFEVTGNRTLVAVFTELAPNEYNIDVSANPAEGGTVTGYGTYTQGQSCTVTATANDGYTFKHWKENGNVIQGAGASYTFTVTGNRTLVAHFEQQSYTITANADPEEGGTVTGAGEYIYGATCILTATPNEGYTFLNWKKDNTIITTNSTLPIVVTESASYTATFAPMQQYTITVEANNDDWGTVEGGGLYLPGVICQLHAIPATGCQFDSWKMNGIVVSTDPNYSFEVVSDATYIAYFSEKTATYYTVTANVTPQNSGTVEGEGRYEAGSEVTLTARPNPGYIFDEWQDGTQDNIYTFILTQDTTFTAKFKQPSFYTISATAGPHGSIDPQGEVQVANGSDVTFTIKPDFGFRIMDILVDNNSIGWADSYTFTNVNCDHTISVSFNGWDVEESTATDVNVFPNPAKEMVFVEGDGLATVSLYDLLGNCLLHMNYEASHGMSLSGIARGVYVLMIKTKDGHIGYQKLIVTK